MRETVQAFERRTGATYAPPAGLQAAARPLAPGDACPTLYRFPGAGALHEHLAGSELTRWGAEGGGWLWLTEVATRARRSAATTFGVLAALQPLHLHPCVHGSGASGRWLAVDRAHAPELTIWVPPRLVSMGPGLDAVPTRAAALDAFGRAAWGDARQRTLDHLSAYLEELSALERAGAVGPDRPWMELPLADRRRVLADHGLSARWTGRRR